MTVMDEDRGLGTVRETSSDRGTASEAGTATKTNGWVTVVTMSTLVVQATVTVAGMIMVGNLHTAVMTGMMLDTSEALTVTTKAVVRVMQTQEKVSEATGKVMRAVELAGMLANTVTTDKGSVAGSVLPVLRMITVEVVRWITEAAELDLVVMIDLRGERTSGVDVVEVTVAVVKNTVVAEEMALAAVAVEVTTTADRSTSQRGIDMLLQRKDLVVTEEATAMTEKALVLVVETVMLDQEKSMEELA